MEKDINLAIQLDMIEAFALSVMGLACLWLVISLIFVYLLLKEIKKDQTLWLELGKPTLWRGQFKLFLFLFSKRVKTLPLSTRKLVNYTRYSLYLGFILLIGVVFGFSYGFNDYPALESLKGVL